MARFCCGPFGYFGLFCVLLLAMLDGFGCMYSLYMIQVAVTSLSCVVFCLRACSYAAVNVSLFLQFPVYLVVSGLLVCPSPSCQEIM